MTAWCHLPTIFKQRRALLIAGLGILFVAFITTLLFATVSHAATSTNRTINFQGRLLTSSGAVVPDGHYNIQFKIYQGGSGAAAGNPDGTLDWTESHINNGGTSGVEVRGGFFSVSLGSITSFGSSVDWDQSTLWLSMNVAGSSTDCTAFGSGSCVGDGEMLPMKQITATPYAINAGQLGGRDASGYIQNTTTPQEASFNISGTGSATQLQTSSLDTATNTGLAIGTTNATSITMGTTAGSSTLNLNAGTGGVNIQGSTQVASTSSTAFSVSNGGADSVLSADTINSVVNVNGTTSIINKNLSGNAPVVVGYSSTTPASASSQSVTTSGATHTGDLVMITAYAEPANEGTASASYGTWTVPSGATTLPGFPIDTGDPTSSSTHRQYAWYYYATTNGSQSLTFTNTGLSKIGLQSVSIRGGPTSGNPLADPATTQTISGSTPGITTTPPISQNLGGTNSLVLWYYSEWYGYGYTPVPTGFTTLVADEKYLNTIASNTYPNAGSTGTLTYPSSGSRGGMTAAIMSFRAPSTGSTTALNVSNVDNAQTFTVDANGNTSIQTATNTASALQVQDANAASVFSVDTAGNAVTIGDGKANGATTLLKLDQATTAPTTTSLGSMYYDTTVGKVQCYQANGWGSCAAAPNTYVTISPEYSGAVMNGTDVGTISSDICSDALNINDGSSGQPTICGTNETHNFYKWTSTEATTQTRSIFVTYKLPSNFKNFVAGSTSLLGRTDSANSGVTYQVYHDNGSGLTSCGSAISVSSGAQTTWQKATASSGNDPSNCSFAAGDSILFRINLSSMSSANAYVSDLSFVFNNN